MRALCAQNEFTNERATFLPRRRLEAGFERDEGQHAAVAMVQDAQRLPAIASGEMLL